MGLDHRVYLDMVKCIRLKMYVTSKIAMIRKVKGLKPFLVS